MYVHVGKADAGGSGWGSAHQGGVRVMLLPQNAALGEAVVATLRAAGLCDELRPTHISNVASPSTRTGSATVLSVPLQGADPVAAACEALVPLLGSEREAHTSQHCGHSVSWGVYPVG
tara:strand:+ start:166 stop:519 length:354 start_codon:yes stop_codon:yes gene_type:complete